MTLTLLPLALRNVTRHRARTAITLGALFFGVAMTLLLSGFLTSLQDALVEDVLHGRVGALQVHRAGYVARRDRQPLGLDLPEGGALEATLRGVPGVAEVAPRLAFGALVSNGRVSAPVVALAVDPARERRTLPLTPVRLGAGRVEAAELGVELAAALGLKPGGALVLQATGRGGRENALDAELTGAVDTGTLFDAKRVGHVPLAFAQRLLGMEGRVTEYAVRLREGEDPDAVAARVRAALGHGYEVHTWRELRPEVAEVIALQQALVLFVGGVFLCIVVMGVVNTLSMSVMERTREIGAMLALGVRSRRVGSLFLLEAAVQGLLGSASGAALAALVLWGVRLAGGVHLAIPGSTTESALHPRVPWEHGLIAVGAALGGALLAGLLPALKAARLRPVDALRG